jgi:hypothetical protein
VTQPLSAKRGTRALPSERRLNCLISSLVQIFEVSKQKSRLSSKLTWLQESSSAIFRNHNPTPSKSPTHIHIAVLVLFYLFASPTNQHVRRQNGIRFHPLPRHLTPIILSLTALPAVLSFTITQSRRRATMRRSDQCWPLILIQKRPQNVRRD